jgi:hypothetical protein
MGALVLHYFVLAWHFSILFLWSFISGCISLYFLRKIPDVPVDHTAQSQNPVPWMSILRYKPFQKVWFFNMIAHMAIGAGQVFYIPLLKDCHHASDSFLLLMNVYMVFICILTYITMGKKLDRVGNKPFLTIATCLLALYYLSWGAVAAGLLPFQLKIVAFQQLIMGIGGAMFGMAYVRMVMGIVPKLGRSHFFAVHTSSIFVILGVSPFIWGMILDHLKQWSVSYSFWNWNGYSLLYVLVGLNMLIATFYLRFIQEDGSLRTHIFIKEIWSQTSSWIFSRTSNQNLE